MTVHVTRLPIQLLPDPRRVITRFFAPGEENRIRDIIKRLLAIPEAKIESLLTSLESNFRLTHPNIDDVFLQHFELVKNHVSGAGELSDNLRWLIGACFTMEYAIESAALFNPSMVPDFDQAGLPPGSVRFLMSLRATGEGHVSSIVFRRGVVDANGGVSVDPPGKHSRPMAAVASDSFEKEYFVRELQALGAWTNHAQTTLTLLGDRFTRAQLSDAIDAVRARASVSGKSVESNDALLALTRANYRLNLPQGGDISELVIFPYSDNERHGIEDMRLVHFTDDDGSCRFYGTYTAYDGSRIFPQLLEYRRGREHRDAHAQRKLCEEQGDGALPAEDRRQVRDGGASGQRKPLLHGVGRRVQVGPRPTAPDAKISLGGDPDRQLRITPRNGGGLATLDARRGPDAPNTALARPCWTMTTLAE